MSQIPTKLSSLSSLWWKAEIVLFYPCTYELTSHILQNCARVRKTNFRAAHGGMADCGENTCKGTRLREAAVNHFLISLFRGRKKQGPKPQPGTPKFLFPALTCWLSQASHFYSSDWISLSSKLGSVHLSTFSVLCRWIEKYLKSKYF